MRIKTLLLIASPVVLALSGGMGQAQTYDDPPPVGGPGYLAPPPPRYGLFGPRYYAGPRAQPLARFCATDLGTCTMRELQPIATPCRCNIDGRRIGGEAVH